MSSRHWLVFTPGVGSPRCKSNVLNVTQGPYCEGRFAPLACSVKANTRPMPLKIWTLIDVAPMLRGKCSMGDSVASVPASFRAQRLHCITPCGTGRRHGRCNHGSSEDHRSRCNQSQCSGLLYLFEVLADHAF